MRKHIVMITIFIMIGLFPFACSDKEEVKPAKNPMNKIVGKRDKEIAEKTNKYAEQANRINKQNEDRYKELDEIQNQ